MLKQAALLIGSLAAAATVATALLFSSLAGPQTTAVATAGTASSASSAPTVQVDTVYVAAPPPQQTITIRQSAPAGEGDDGEAGSEGDD